MPDNRQRTLTGPCSKLSDLLETAVEGRDGSEGEVSGDGLGVVIVLVERMAGLDGGAVGAVGDRSGGERREGP